MGNLSERAMAVASRTLKRYRNYAAFALNTFLLGRIRPFLFILVINDQCNLDCFYCASKNTGAYDLGKTQVWPALSAAYDRGHRALVITGGEPMLWQSNGAAIGDAVRHARRLGFQDIAIFTNGTFPLHLEKVAFIVTIDGTRSAHNAIRAGTYDKIIGHVRDAASPVTASITLSKTNADDLEAAVDQIARLDIFRGITFNLLTHNPDIVARHGLMGQERRLILDRIWRLKCQGYPIMLSKAAYSALRRNSWKRPVRQIQLLAGQRLFTCCRDVGHPDICRNCGYSSCAEIAMAVAGRPSAIWALIKAS